MDSPFSPWQPSEQEPWDIVRVAHLHRRAGFTPDWATIQLGLREGVQTTVERLLGKRRRNNEAVETVETVDKAEEQFEQLAATIGEAAVGSGNADRLRAWWVFRMLMTPRPLMERMTLLWHNHFATSNEKVRDVSAMFEQNNLLRKHCLAQFGLLLPAVVKHRAMLSWLDATANRKEHPNENLARELMELFTLGEGHYREADVVNAARCLTGWTVRSNRFEFVAELHDDGEKTVLGQTGNFDGDGLLALLLKQEATAKRIANRLSEMFFGEGVADEAAIDELATGLQQNQLQIAWAVETILRSRLFYSSVNIRSRIPCPVELVMGTVRALELQRDTPSTLLLAVELRRLGQDLFHPPNVFGWPEGRAWIHTRSVLGRQRFIAALVAGKLHPTEHGPVDVARVPKLYGIGATGQQLLDFYRLLISHQIPSSVSNDRQIDTTEQERVRSELIEILSDAESQLS